jgi:hypothetical protein
MIRNLNTILQIGFWKYSFVKKSTHIKYKVTDYYTFGFLIDLCIFQIFAGVKYKYPLLQIKQ